MVKRAIDFLALYKSYEPKHTVHPQAIRTMQLLR